jgi:hypothetical protein
MKVMSEFATIQLALDGWSLSRFGDGEIKMAAGTGYVREPGSPKLATELSGILRRPRDKCLPCIPTFDPEGPKGGNWQRHKRRFEAAIVPEYRYGSAFISRPDSAPWINTRAYYNLISQLWAGKTVNVLAEPGNSILKVLELTARKIRHIECPHRESYAHIDEFEKALRAGKPGIIVMSCGPTATCLANRLSKYHHAIDIGSAGGFLLKLACAR